MGYLKVLESVQGEIGEGVVGNKMRRKRKKKETGGESVMSKVRAGGWSWGNGG